jgi:hypothetical protein
VELYPVSTESLSVVCCGVRNQQLFFQPSEHHGRSKPTELPPRLRQQQKKQQQQQRSTLIDDDRGLSHRKMKASPVES